MAAIVATLLNNLKAALAAIEGVNTCKVGLEQNMQPDDYPIIRIVPSRLLPARVLGRRRAEVLVYFGNPIHEFEEGLTEATSGLENLYALLLEREEQIIAAAGSSPLFGAVYLDTVMDEDRSVAFKMMALRFDIEG
jgi:hypothetical protein